MADNFILRWEFDNATEQLETGKVESGVFNAGGFKWIVALEKRDGHEYLSLRCGVDHNGPWECQVDLLKHVLNRDGIRCMIGNTRRINFTDANCQQDREINFRALIHPRFLVDDKVTFEIDVKIHSAERGQAIPSIFDAPNRRSNVILIIGDKKLHVSKELLAFHSPVFDTLFFGNFSEKGKEEVEIKEVVYEEFLDLLDYIGLVTRVITDRTVFHLFKLADRFEIMTVREESLMHLTHSKGIDVVKKLLIADEYNIHCLRDHCLNSFACVTDLIEKVKSSPEYDNFSGEMKIKICDRIMNFQ